MADEGADEVTDLGRSEAQLVEAQLVEGLRGRERDAFAGLNERYAPGIYNLALRMVRHRPDAEDITQDVLIRAFERVPRDRDVMLKPWLYRMTINRCYDHLRARKRHGGSCPDDQPDVRAVGDPYEKALQGRLFEAALQSLTSRQRAAMVLRDVHGLSLPEIGAALDIKTASVEVLLARGRNVFRARYAELCREEGMPAPAGVHSFIGLGLLGMLPLPARLQVPPALPAPVLTDPAMLHNLEPAVGAGLGAALGSSSLAKLAAAVLAAVTLAGAGEVATQHRHARPLRPSTAPASVAQSPAPRPSSVAATPGRGANDPDAAVTPSPTASAGPDLVAEASPSPSTSPAPDATPSPDSTPLGALPPTPTPTPTTSATPDPSPTPTPEPTVDPTATPTPAPSSTTP